jgi:hypothetical protein
MSSRLRATTKRTLSLFILILILVPGMIVLPVGANGPDSRYFRVRTAVVGHGRVIAESVISGPPDAPFGYLRATSQLPGPDATAGVNVLSDVPAFNWSFGCSATSAAMIAGYVTTQAVRT